MFDVSSSQRAAERPAAGPVRFYTVEQVAAMLQLSKYRVYEIIRMRLLPAIHIGRQIRVEESALMQWAQATRN
jgi:excisionase family DNA binding protein